MSSVNITAWMNELLSQRNEYLRRWIRRKGKIVAYTSMQPNLSHVEHMYREKSHLLQTYIRR